MTDDTVQFDRRALFRAAGAGATGLLIGESAARAQRFLPPSPVDTGAVEGGRVRFPEWRAPADAPSAPPPAPLPPEQRVGFAIVGLGRLALEEILPAFGACMKAKPVALVSGSPEKLALVARQYGIPPERCYSYERFDAIRDDPAIRAVYVVLPNAMHRLYTERAARAGKHVLCEKPMATSVADAEAMVQACARAKVKLMIAYRIQYEPYNRRARELVQHGQFGRLVGFTGINVQTVAADGARQWRHKKAMAGGGALFDIGLYCLNTARFVTGEEPVALWATSLSPPGDPRFAEVEETVSFTLRFPSGTIANAFTSYGARDDKHQRLDLAGATIEMPNAYLYRGQEMHVIHRAGDETSQDRLSIPPKNQFAAEMDHFADCILADKRPHTPGEEGVQDHRLMEAIYRSAGSGAPVTFAPIEGRDRFRGPEPVQEKG